MALPAVSSTFPVRDTAGWLRRLKEGISLSNFNFQNIIAEIVQSRALVPCVSTPPCAIVWL